MTQATQPLVSIIVPVYNVERYVDECLASIRAQTYANLEILVVEDCSTDGSLRALEPHLKDARVRLIRHERNGGLSAARNTGIEAASGEYVMFVDSDDVIAAGLVEACSASAVKEGADLVVFGTASFEDGSPVPLIELSSDKAIGAPLTRKEYLSLRHFAWLKFIRAEILSRSRLRFPVGYYYEDWPFHWRLGSQMGRIHKLEVEGVAYRQRTSSITRLDGKQLLDQFSVQEMVLESLNQSEWLEVGEIFVEKLFRSSWGVLFRIDKRFLPEAVSLAKTLHSHVSARGLFMPQDWRARILHVLFALPGPFSFFILRALRSTKRWAGRVIRSRS